MATCDLTRALGGLRGEGGVAGGREGPRGGRVEGPRSRQSPSAVGATESEEGRAPPRESGLCSWPQSMGRGPAAERGRGARGGVLQEARVLLLAITSEGHRAADDVSGCASPAVSGDRGGSGGRGHNQLAPCHRHRGQNLVHMTPALNTTVTRPRRWPYYAVETRRCRGAELRKVVI